MKPGEYLIDNALDLITINSDRATASVLVRHTGDRPIQVGSHFHFFEVNRALDFDRAVAHGGTLRAGRRETGCLGCVWWQSDCLRPQRACQWLTG